ncbi:MAG: MipA/OmpV family protein [Planctomycetaceae bacterium]|nr:MipA/OmpV family protein [Planctomycetaceae bacterium]
MRTITAMTIMMLVWSGVGQAQEPAAGGEAEAAQTPAGQGDSFSLGAGAVYSNGLYRGADDEFIGAPFIYFQKGQFFINVRTAGYRLYQDEHFAFDAIAQWRFDGFDADDSDFLEGMDDREMTIDAGAALTVFDGWGQTTISYVGDTLSKYSGQELTIAYSKTFSRGKWSFTPAAGVRYFSSSLGDYYYGVQPDEAIAGRPAYDIGDTWNPYAGALLGYAINEQWSIRTSVRYTMLNDDIEDSPIVEDGYDLLMMFGIVYTF